MDVFKTNWSEGDWGISGGLGVFCVIKTMTPIARRTPAAGMRNRFFMITRYLISRIRVSSQEELDVAYGIDEAVEAILFIIEQGIGGDHDFPIRIPGTAPNEARVGELSRHRAVEVGGIIHGTEGLVFPGDPEFFVQCPAGSEDLAFGECRRTDIFRQGKRLVAHGPRTKRVLVAERGNTHHIHTSRNEINIRRRADRIGI